MDTWFLDEIIASHGGAERWAQVRELKLHLRVGGNILALKFKSPRSRSLECVIDPRRIHAVLKPFPGICALELYRHPASFSLAWIRVSLWWDVG